jgi:hemoglobin-like flavoprotein
MTLIPQQKRLVRSTWALVKPMQEEAARLFYDRPFEIDPSTRPLFASTDIAEQGKKLMQMINVAIAGLERLDTLRSAIKDLGRRHAGYGVKEEHYESVGAALLWTLGQGLGEEFTPEVEEAWAQTYGMLTAIIKNGAAAAQHGSPLTPSGASVS